VRIDWRKRSCIALLVALCVAALAGCCHSVVVHVGAPYDRYDHNRSRGVIADGVRGGQPTGLVDEVYSPWGEPSFPGVRFEEDGSGDDGLDPGRLVPIFSGVPLPLSGAPVRGGRSDRDDLIDFLAAGPDAQDGIEPARMPGDTRGTAARYQPVLSLLESVDLLRVGRTGIAEVDAYRDLQWADDLIDSRYRGRAFADIQAFRFEDFWFVLYRLPEKQSCSRLVVLPIKTRGQNRDKKTPTGDQ
jgi:hypothetical protein